MSAVRVAVVGAGLMGRWHAHAAARAGGVVAGFADPEVARARELAGAFGRCGAYPSLEELLSREEVEVVHVCSSLPTHESLAAVALEAGCHALVEKPLAPDAEATARLLELARRRDRLLCPVHQFLFQRGVRRARAALPRIGRVRHLDFVACSAGARGLPEEERDEVVADILPHPLAILARFLPAPLSGMEWRAHRPAPGELRVSGGAAGATAGLLLSLSGRPTRLTFRIVGEGGTLHLDLFHGFGVREPGRASRAQKIGRPFGLAGRTLWRAATNLAVRSARGEPAYPGLRDLIREFYIAARTRGAPPVAPEETLEVAAARDRIRALAG